MWNLAGGWRLKGPCIIEISFGLNALSPGFLILGQTLSKNQLTERGKAMGNQSEPEHAQDRRDVMKLALAGAAGAVVASTARAKDGSGYQPIFTRHRYPERQVNLGEISLNYVTAGSAKKPALLLIPAQTESWWGYEAALDLLKDDFQCFAVDLRGQGRSSWTPGRYSLDIIGNDLVRFIDAVVQRPVIVCGNSSGGVLAAWLAGFSKPSQLHGVYCEDPPLWSIEIAPSIGPSTRQAIGPLFQLRSSFLGDQWKIADWAGWQRALATLPGWSRFYPRSAEPPQNMREYDPEWGRACAEGTFAANAPAQSFLSQAKVPMLLTHHARKTDPETGILLGALTDFQAQKAGELVRAAGHAFTYKSFPQAAHIMHAADPATYVQTLKEWAAGLQLR
jgi:pimeloyl-ACP methyl ester carboxylesterase